MNIYKNYGECMRGLQFSGKFTEPKKINRKVEILLGYMLSNAKIGNCINLEKFLTRIAKKWNGEGFFTTADMFSPSDIKQALRIFYARVTSGKYTFPVECMWEVIENKGLKILTLCCTRYKPNLFEIETSEKIDTKNISEEKVNSAVSKDDIAEKTKDPLDKFEINDIVAYLEKHGYKCLKDGVLNKVA